jgi:hypothetical protein
MVNWSPALGRVGSRPYYVQAGTLPLFTALTSGKTRTLSHGYVQVLCSADVFKLETDKRRLLTVLQSLRMRMRTMIYFADVSRCINRGFDTYV